MAEYSLLEKLCIVVLVLVLHYYIMKVWRCLYTFSMGPAINKVDFKSKGQWALITGSTDGIGKEYALQLAAKGCDIILVSRTMEKLKAVAEEIEKEYKVNTKVIQADFCAGEDIYEHIAKEVENLEIGTLVNNVGMSYTYPEYFLDIPERDQLVSNLIKANIVSVTRVTAIVLPGMEQRGKGVVINLGSASSIIPSPLLTVYAATKAYVDKFSEGLEMEYGQKGIIVQCILPGFVCSNMSGIRRSTFFAPLPKNFVQSALKLVGTTTKSTGYFPHAIFVNVLNAIKGLSYTLGVWLVTRSMENSRGRMLRKYKNL